MVRLRYIFRLFPYLALCIACCFSAGAQNNRDSLIAIVQNNNQPDSLRLRTILNLTTSMADSTDMRWIATGRDIVQHYREDRPAWLPGAEVELCLNEAYFFHDHKGQHEQAISLTENCLQMAKKLNNHSLIGRAYNNIGVMYYALGNVDDCLGNLQTALPHRRSAGEMEALTQSYSNIGFILFKTGLLSQGLDYLYRAVALADSLDNLNLKGTALHYLGQIYDQQGSYDRMLDIARQTLAIAKTLGDERRIASGYNNVGSSHEKLGNLDSAGYYYQRSLAIRRSINFDFGIANSLNNIGYLKMKAKDYRESLNYYRDALYLWKKINNAEGSITTITNLSKCFREMNQADSSLFYAQQGFNMAVQLKSWEDKKENSRLMAQAYENMGQTRKALAAYQDYMAASAELYNEENVRLIEQKALSYEFDQREATLRAEESQKQALLTEQLKGQRRTRNLSLLALGMGILAAAIWYNRYKVINRTRRQLEVERLRNAIASDLHDDLGSTLSSIQILSQMALQKKEAENKDTFSKINTHSSAMMDRLSEIVWSIHPGNDNLEEMIVKMKEFAEEILEPRGIEYHFEVSPGIEQTSLDLEKRRNIYLIFKEAVNNAAKYSDSNKISIRISAENRLLQLEVRDQGKGFDTTTLLRGNGLRNMRERAGAIGATIHITSQPGMGTSIRLEAPGA